MTIPRQRQTAEDTTDDIIRVSPPALLALARAADSLSLHAVGVRALQSGHYLSSFKGRGMEFDEVRPYQAGDDIRSIDWKVTARTGKPHTKLFREERERPVLICTDIKRSMFFATRGAYKAVIASHAATLLAWSACAKGDRVGGLIFSDHQHQELRPRRGKSAVLHFIKTLCAAPAWNTAIQQPANPATLQTALGRLQRVARPGSLLILISDFKYLNETAVACLAHLARHCNILLIHISDPIEQALPVNGRYHLNDGKREINLDTHDKNLREHYAERFTAHAQYLQQLCKKYALHYLHLSTRDNVLSKLQQKLGTTTTATRATP